jgi:replicative DNA helicase
MDHQNQALTKHSKQQYGKTKPLDLSTMVYGKIPPQAKELEEAVLGAIMIEKGAFDAVSELLHADCFYVDAHQRIFRAMSSLAGKGSPIDLLTLVQETISREELDKVGGAYYLTGLTKSVSSSANIVSHAKIIVQKFIQREVIRVSGELLGLAYEDSTDAFELVDHAEQKIYEIAAHMNKQDVKKLGDGIPELLDRIETLKQQDRTITGVPTNFRELDKVTLGWQPTDLIIAAARPGVGKTSFALNIAVNAVLADHGCNVAFFSLEMSFQQLLKRIMARHSGISLTQINNGRIHNTKPLYDSSEQMMKWGFYVDDTAAITIFQLRAKARRLVSKYQVGMIIVDYLQLMNGVAGKNGNREQEISTISRGLKQIAKELNVPIIALSQLSREVEKRGKGQKVPQLSDLRESGAIEQDADMVLFLYRPADDEIQEDAELQNKGMVKIAKHRNGSLEDFAFEVNNALQEWKEIGLLNTRWVPVPQQDFQSKINHIKNNQKDDTPF